MMDTRSLDRSTQERAPAARYMVVTASSLAMAGLLGACASTGAPRDNAQATPAPADTAKTAKSGSERLPVIGVLKDAESALSDYAKARHQEATLREAAQAAADAALVARHRQTIGVPDFALVAEADQRQANAERDLRIGEAATRAARERLYRVFGFSGGDKRQGGSGSIMPVGVPLGGLAAEVGAQPLVAPAQAPRFASSRLL
jgi:hypothetical protein